MGESLIFQLFSKPRKICMEKEKQAKETSISIYKDFTLRLIKIATLRANRHLAIRIQKLTTILHRVPPVTKSIPFVISNAIVLQIA